jgi:hypothetical protein
MSFGVITLKLISSEASDKKELNLCLVPFRLTADMNILLNVLLLQLETLPYLCLVFVTQWITQSRDVVSRQECLDVSVFSKTRAIVCTFSFCDNIPLYVRTGVCEGKVHPVTGYEDKRGSRGIALLFL